MLLFGGSGHAKVIRDCLKSKGEEVKCIFDDNPVITKLDDTPVVGKYNPQSFSDELVIISIGDNRIRKIVSEKITHQFGKAIHSSVILSEYSSIDEGSVAMQTSVINAGTKVGKHCIINTGAVVEHDCIVEDFVHISPNTTICGGVKIGEGTHIGAGATVIPNITIGKWCVIGAGTVIRNNIPDYSLVVGVPGRVVRSLITKI